MAITANQNPDMERAPDDVIEAELSDLTNGEIPYFCGLQTRHISHHSGRYIENALGKSPSEPISESLARMTPSDFLQEENRLCELLMESGKS